MAIEKATGLKLHLGCGKNIMPGWVNLDMVDGPGVDIVANLEILSAAPIPLPDDSVETILGSHVIEHVHFTLGMMQDLWRVSRPGATATFHLPYGSSDDAWEDQTHVRPFFQGSFLPFSQPYYWRADYGYRGDWQCRRVLLKVPAERYRGVEATQILAEVQCLRNVVREMTVDLVAIKPGREQKRELLEGPKVELALV